MSFTKPYTKTGIGLLSSKRVNEHTNSESHKPVGHCLGRKRRVYCVDLSLLNIFSSTSSHNTSRKNSGADEHILLCSAEITPPRTIISCRRGGSGFPLFNCELMMIARGNVNVLWKEHKTSWTTNTRLDSQRKEYTIGKKHLAPYSRWPR